MSPATDVPITLRGGFVVRTSVFSWLIDASFRLTFAVADGSLIVRPRRAITASDDTYLRAHRDEILAAVRYIDTLASEPLQ